MPNTGMPCSNRRGSTCGAPSAYTDCGPPDRMIPAGCRAAMASTDAVCGTISEYTFASRTRRAMSWAYWAPKSTTRTGACVVCVDAVWGNHGRDRPCQAGDAQGSRVVGHRAPVHQERLGSGRVQVVAPEGVVDPHAPLGRLARGRAPAGRRRRRTTPPWRAAHALAAAAREEFGEGVLARSGAAPTCRGSTGPRSRRRPGRPPTRRRRGARRSTGWRTTRGCGRSGRRIQDDEGVAQLADPRQDPLPHPGVGARRGVERVPGSATAPRRAPAGGAARSGSPGPSQQHVGRPYTRRSGRTGARAGRARSGSGRGWRGRSSAGRRGDEGAARGAGRRRGLRAGRGAARAPPPPPPPPPPPLRPASPHDGRAPPPPASSRRCARRAVVPPPPPPVEQPDRLEVGAVGAGGQHAEGVGEVGLGDRVRPAPSGPAPPPRRSGTPRARAARGASRGAALGDAPGHAGVRPRAVEGQAGGVLGGDADGHLAEAGQLGRALTPTASAPGRSTPRPGPSPSHHALGRPVDGDLGEAGGPDEGQPAVVGPAAKPQASSSGSVRAPRPRARAHPDLAGCGAPGPTCHVTTRACGARVGEGVRRRERAPVVGAPRPGEATSSTRVGLSTSSTPPRRPAGRRGEAEHAPVDGRPTRRRGPRRPAPDGPWPGRRLPPRRPAVGSRRGCVRGP